MELCTELPFNIAHLSLCLQSTKVKGNNSLNRVPELHSLCKCCGSECTAGKEQQVLPVLEEFPAFPHPKVFCWLLLTCQINDRLWASENSPRDRVPFKTSSLLWHQLQELSWPHLVHLKHRGSAPFLQKSTSDHFPGTIQATPSAKHRCGSLLFVNALKNLIKRTIFAPRGGKFLCFPGAHKYVKWWCAALHRCQQEDAPSTSLAFGNIDHICIYMNIYK